MRVADTGVPLAAAAADADASSRNTDHRDEQQQPSRGFSFAAFVVGLFLYAMWAGLFLFAVKHPRLFDHGPFRLMINTFETTAERFGRMRLMKYLLSEEEGSRRTRISRNDFDRLPSSPESLVEQVGEDEEGTDGSLVVIRSASELEALTKENVLLTVIFSSSRCDCCEKFVAEWARLATAKVTIAKVDCDGEAAELCREQNITDYPTLDNYVVGMQSRLIMGLRDLQSPTGVDALERIQEAPNTKKSPELGQDLENANSDSQAGPFKEDAPDTSDGGDTGVLTQSEEPEDPSDSVVVIRSVAEFDALEKEHRYLFVNFYTPWCTWCRRMDPEWSRLATALAVNRDPITVVKVNCDGEASDVCQQERVASYPTLRLYANGEPLETITDAGHILHEGMYFGDRTAASMMDFLKKFVMGVIIPEEYPPTGNFQHINTVPIRNKYPSKVPEEDTVDEFDEGNYEYLPENANHEKVLDHKDDVIAPDEEYLEETLASGRSMDEDDDEVDDGVEIEQVEDESSVIGEDDESPDSTANKSEEPHQANVGVPNVAVVTRLENSPEEGEAPSPEEEENGNLISATAEQDEHPPCGREISQVVSLDSVDLDTAKKENKFLFVNFYHPECVWSQRLTPTWDRLTKLFGSDTISIDDTISPQALQEARQIESPVKIVTVDCVKQEEQCREEIVRAFPTMRLYVEGEPGPTFSGDRTVLAMTRFLKSAVNKSYLRGSQVSFLERLFGNMEGPPNETSTEDLNPKAHAIEPVLQ